MKKTTKMENPCNILLKEGYVLGCEWDYNDDSRGNFAPVICSACGRKRNFDLKESLLLVEHVESRA